MSNPLKEIQDPTTEIANPLTEMAYPLIETSNQTKKTTYFFWVVSKNGIVLI